MKLLNLGCGSCYHSDWINVDFVSNTKNIIAHNLLKGIPFESNYFDVVYHSHLLEHFPKNKSTEFILECYRVLKPGGVIRIVVPNLEVIIREYLEKLEKSIEGDEAAKYDYEWIMLELFDQMVRNNSGGQMAKYFFQEEISNLEYVYKRIGQEGYKIREQYLKSLGDVSIEKPENSPESFYIKKIKFLVRKTLSYFSFKKRVDQTEAFKIGNFRLSGEVHLWMYDRYSISKLLENAGLKDIKVTNAQKSYVENWGIFFLDTLPDGTIRKPDSLFIEAKKPLD